MHRAHRVVHRARTAQAFLATLFCIFQVFFRVARTRWPKGYAYNNGDLHSSLLTKGGCSCPHPLPGEGRRKRKKKPVAIVRHRDSHRNLAWRPISQPHGLTTREGQIVVRCRKQHKGKEKVVRARGKRPHRAHRAGAFL